MRVSYDHPSIKLTGRWDTTDARMAQTTNTGSYIDFAFEGRMAMALFDLTLNSVPELHLWIQVDGGAMVEAPIDYYLRVVAPTDGRHTVRIIYKGGLEESNRWQIPLQAKVSFLGVDAEKLVDMPEDTRPTIEFVGDSITEGVLIDADVHQKGYFFRDLSQLNRTHQDDVCGTYAWLTAEGLNMRPIMMGYGAVGVTKGGCGRVPPAPKAYPYNYEGSPITHTSDVIVINHGANDRRVTADKYLPKYEELLDVIRNKQPNATIISVSAFCGAFHTELGEFIDSYNQKNGCNVHFVDTNGWIPLEPLHPLRDGHRIVANKLIPIIKGIIEANA